jgi:hypothetical protein
MAKSALLHTWPQNVPGNMSSSSLAHGHCPWLCFSPSALLPLPLYSVTIPILSPLLTGVLVHHCASEQILPPRHKCGAQGATEDGGGLGSSHWEWPRKQRESTALPTWAHLQNTWDMTWGPESLHKAPKYTFSGVKV